MKKIIKPKREIIKPKRRGFVPLSQVDHKNIYDAFAYVAVGGKLRVVRTVPSVADEDVNSIVVASESSVTTTLTSLASVSTSAPWS